MPRYERLSPKLVGAHLLYGKIELKLTHGFSCFFIVNQTEDKEFLEKTAMDFILSSCKDFHFFGEKEPIWHTAFDLVDSLVFPNSTSETVALTSGYQTVEDFSEALKDMISARTFVPHDVFLIYDDERIYRQVLSLVGISN